MKRVLTPMNIIGLLLLLLGFYAKEYVSRPPSQPTPPTLQLEATQPQNFTVYFSDTQVSSFVKESRSVPVEGKSPGKIAQAAADAWSRGPQNAQGLRVVPQGSNVPTVWVRGPHYVVSLPQSYTKFNYGLSGERMIICSLARTLLEKGGQDVLFLVAGQSAPTLLGHMDLRRAYGKTDCPG